MMGFEEVVGGLVGRYGELVRKEREANGEV